MIVTSSLAALALGAATVPPQAPARVPPAVNPAGNQAAVPATPAAPAAPPKPDWLPKPKPWLAPDAAKPAPKLRAAKL